MVAILSLPHLGTVLTYCYTDATPTTGGGFAFQNTTAKPVVVSGAGILKPGERTFSNMAAIQTTFYGTAGAGTFQVTSTFSDPDQIATVTVSGIVQGTVCQGHAHATVQP
jgi:hypothetical protein